MKAAKSKGVKHTHIVYIYRSGEYGITSLKAGHSHNIYQEKIVVEDVDELGNIITRIEPGNLVVGEADGHTHPLQDIPFSEVEDPFEKKYTEEEDLEVANDLHKFACNLEDVWFKEAEIDNEFYKGYQWRQEDVTRLDRVKRAHVTHNELKPKVKLLLGQQKKNRTDMKLLPDEDGDSRIADTFNIAIKKVCTNENYVYKESRAFEDALVPGRGLLQVEISNADNITGDVKIRQRPWHDGFFGEHHELDGSDAEYAGIHTWHSMARLKTLYPQKSNDISMDFDLRSTSYNSEPEDKRDYFKRDVYKKDLMKSQFDIVDIANKNYLLVEVQWKIYKRTPVLFNAADNEYVNVSGMSESDIKEAETIQDIGYTVDVKYKIRRVVFAGTVVLERGWSLFNDINIVPFIGNSRDGEISGIIRGARDAQIELNKRSSQYLDIINFGARYLLLFSSDAFASEADYQEWLERNMDPTFQPNLAAGFQNHMHQLDGIKYPSEIIEAIRLSREAITRIMNIPEALMGNETELSSGVAIAQKIRQGWTGNEDYYDNLNLSKKRVCKLIIQGIKIVYSPEKLLRLRESTANNKDIMSDAETLYPPMSIEEKLALAGETGKISKAEQMNIIKMLQANKPISNEMQIKLDEMEQIRIKHTREELLFMLENEDVFRYDITISTSSSSPNIMMSNFMMLMDMAGHGVPIPPTMIVKSWPEMDSRQKKELIDAIREGEAAKAQAEDRKYTAEIQKTQIAQLGKGGLLPQQGGIQ